MMKFCRIYAGKSGFFFLLLIIMLSTALQSEEFDLYGKIESKEKA